MLQYPSVAIGIVMMKAEPVLFAHVLLITIWQGYSDIGTRVFLLSAGQLRRTPGCWDECQMVDRYVYKFKILIFFQCLHMLFM